MASGVERTSEERLSTAAPALRVEAFARYDAIHKRKLLTRLPNDVLDKLLPPGTAQKIENEFQAVKARFTKEVCACGRKGLIASWTEPQIDRPFA
jgi:hypothetical protein